MTQPGAIVARTALAVGLVAISTPVEVAHGAHEARSVTLEAALEAVSRAPMHVTSAARAEAAAAGVPAASGWPATTIGVASNRQTARLVVSATLPLPVLGTARTRKAAVVSARAERAVAIAETGVVDLDLEREVARAWLGLARAEAHADASARSAERQASLAVIAAKRVDAGDVPRAEQVQAEAVAKRALAVAATDRTATDVASAELATVLGWDPTERLHADGGLPALSTVPTLADLRASPGIHPAVRVTSALEEVASARVAEASAARWPVLAFDVEGSFDDPTSPGSDVRLGISLELPLLGKRAAGQRAAEARRKAAGVERVATETAIEGALVAAYRRFEAARDNARTLELEVVPAQEAAAELAATAYREGAGDLASVLEAERSLASAAAEAVDARIDAALAYADLTWSAGRAR